MKKLPLLLALSLTASALASCGGTETPTDTTTAAETTTQAPETAEWVNPGVNYKGEEFTFMDYEVENYFWQAQAYSNLRAEEESGEPINDSQYKRNRKVEEELGVTLTSFHGKVIDLTKSVMAGDDEIDAAFVFMDEVQRFFDGEEYIIDLNTLPGFNVDASWWDQKAVDEFTLGGKLSLITGDASLYTAFASQVIFYSKTLADQFNITDLYQLVRDGKWTADEYFDYGKLVAADVDGDGEMGMNDRYGAAIDSGSIAAIFEASGIRYSEKKGDDVQIVINNERTVNVYEKYIDWLNDGEVNMLVKDYRNNGYSNIYYELQLPTFEADKALFFPNQILISFELRSMDTDFGVLPYPKFDEAQDGYHTPVNRNWAMLLCVPTTNTKREMTAQVLDAIGYYSQQIVTPSFIETTVFNKTLRDEESAEIFRMALDCKNFDIAYIFDWGTLTTSLYSMSESAQSFVTTYARLENAIKSELEATLASLK